MAVYLGIIKAYEGLGPNIRLTPQGKLIFPYQCKADAPRKDGTHPWTCGYGHFMSIKEERDGVQLGSKPINVMRDGLTEDQCDQLLNQDVAKRLAVVKAALPGQNDLVIGAFLDCVLNAGEECLHSSPGLAIIRGDLSFAAERLLLYRNAGGHPVRGLWRRRLTDSIFMLSGEIITSKDSVPKNKLLMSASEQVATKRLSTLLGKPILLPPGMS